MKLAEILIACCPSINLINETYSTIKSVSLRTIFLTHYLKREFEISKNDLYSVHIHFTVLKFNCLKSEGNYL